MSASAANPGSNAGIPAKLAIAAKRTTGAGAAAKEIAGRLPVPMLLMPGLDTARANAAGLRFRDRGATSGAAGASALS